MGIDATHPLYGEMDDDWQLMRDTYRGQRIVKKQALKYLPATSGMIQDGMANSQSPGYKQYEAYKTRAYVPDLVREAVEAAIGVMHQKPPVIELPESMEPLREMATLRRESLEVLLRRINEAQLICGRLGLLVDFPSNTRESDPDLDGTDEVRTVGPLPDPTVPYIALYDCESIINWDQGYRDGLGVDTLNMVVLDESEFERSDGFTWSNQKKYRLLLLSGDDDTNVATGTYQFAVYRDNRNDFDPEDLSTPMFRGNTMEEIPFTIINSKDVVADPDDPPLLGLANLVLSIYRQDADYKQTLFMQGQDTLVITGGGDEDEETRIGSGAKITLPMGGTAAYIGVESKGLEEMRTSIENDRSMAKSKAGQLLDTVSRERESGEALNIRVAARTASLKQIALAGAFGLQQALRHAATWIGANPEEVVVTPNLDFVDDNFKPDDLVKMMTAKGLGAPLSLESIHEYLREKDVTSLEFEEEMDKLEEEAEALASQSEGLDDEGDDVDDDPEEEGDDDGDGDAPGNDE